MYGIVSGGKLLLAANRARLESGGATPYELWQLAAEDAENAQTRARLFHHAMIHAGYLVEAETTRPYPTCPQCGETLGAR